MKKLLSAFISATFFLFSLPLNLMSFADEYKPFNGSGTEADPYQISSSYELQLLSELVNDADTTAEYTSCYYIQTADIDLKNVAFVPIGTFEKTSASFKGNYNGNYHKIDNLNVSGKKYVGLFGRTLGANLQNLSVYGSVYGINEENGEAHPNMIGGFIGESYKSNILNCSFTGTVSSKTLGLAYSGGFCGVMSCGGTITSCYFHGTFEGCGIKNGGVIGQIKDFGFESEFAVKNCYAVGNIISESNDSIGGVIGDVEYTAENTQVTVSNNYYLKAMAETGINGQVTTGCNPLSETLLKNSAELLGSPFVTNTDETLNDGYPVFEWQITPYQFKGSGTETDPYQISSKEELKIMRDLVNSKFFTSYNEAYYIQTADIDLQNEQWTPIGTFVIDNALNSNAAFYGNYDGNYHCIKNLNVNESSNYSGLFGRLGENKSGIVKNLSVSGNVNSSGIFTGGICGEISFDSKIFNCSFNGTVNGNNYVGGIAGKIHKDGTISSCYSNCTVNGTSKVGGILGLNGENCNFTLTNSYHTGKVTSETDNSGAIVGEIWNNDDGSIVSIKNCYYTNSDAKQAVTGEYDGDILALSPSLLKLIAEDLGTAFVKSPDNSLNNGDPVFTWQISGTGDVNGDGSFNVSDVVLFQRWLLHDKTASLNNWKNADFYADGILNIFDLCLMKRMLINQS